jgi:hypothetical protein
MYLRVGYKKKIWRKNNIFASLKSLKKEVGSGSISQRYGTDPWNLIRSKMSRIPNTVNYRYFMYMEQHVLQQMIIKTKYARNLKFLQADPYDAEVVPWLM